MSANRRSGIEARGVSRRCAASALVALAGAGAAPLSRADHEPLVLGIVPYLSARRLVQLYDPIRKHLTDALQRTVLIESASDYEVFQRRTAAGQYDFTADSPYFARLAQLDYGFVPLARPLTMLEPLIVTRVDVGIRSIAELRGRTISSTDRLATLTLSGMRYLIAQGLKPGVDVSVRTTSSHANSIATLMDGQSAAAIISVSALKQIGNHIEQHLRILAHMEPTTPLLYMAHPRLGPALTHRLREVMTQFANSPGPGQQFVDALGHKGLQAVTAKDMQALDGGVTEVRRLLAT
jgi:phosphonate transport system substrate-binding protein